MVLCPGEGGGRKLRLTTFVTDRLLTGAQDTFLCIIASFLNTFQHLAQNYCVARLGNGIMSSRYKHKRSWQKKLNFCSCLVSEGGFFSCVKFQNTSNV